MKVQVSKEWINLYEQHLFIINTVPSDNPGKLNSKGQYLNNGSFVLKGIDGGWVYIGYMDDIIVIEGEESVNIEDSAQEHGSLPLQLVLELCELVNIQERRELLEKRMIIENSEIEPDISGLGEVLEELSIV